MAVPEVFNQLREELEAMGFPLARATRALHYSGNSTLEDAVNWIFDHENDPDIDQMPMVPVEINLEDPKPFEITEQVRTKAEELRNGAHKTQVKEDELESKGKREKELERERGKENELERVEEIEKEMEREGGKEKALERARGKEQELEREREKERIRAGKEFLAPKRIAEDNERKRMMASRRAEKEEERRAREKVHQKLEADKAERRSRVGLPPDSRAAIPPKPRTSQPPEVVTSTAVLSTKHSVLLTNCLRTLRRTHKDDEAKVRKAYQTLQIYVRNVMKNPDEEKFRRIRLTNPVFQDRVGSLKGGIRFLELCGFDRVNGAQFLYLPRSKVDLALLNEALAALNSAMTNPYFGLLSVDLADV